MRSSLKLPAAVELISAGNPDVIVPQDIAVCTSCGNHQFQWQASTQSTVPAVGDTYGLKVTYSDGTSEEIIGRWFARRPADVTERVRAAMDD